MSQVVTELVIDADTSRVDDYNRAMDGAAQASMRGSDAAMGFGTTIAAVGAGSIAAIAGLKSMLDYVVDANKQLADLQSVARQTGLTLADLQGVKFGGVISGLSDPQINAGLERSAALLNDAQRNANSLTKELDANGISVRNSNGQMISQNQLLGIAADLVKRANSPGDQLVIAQMLGFTKEWIPLLQQGSSTMAALTDEARKAGAVIGDETINRAAEFDAQWRKSSVEWSANMKAAIADMLPQIDDYIDRAVKFIKDVRERARNASTPEAIAGAVLDSAGVDKGKGFFIDTTALQKAREDFNKAQFMQSDTWVDLGKSLWAGFSYGHLTDFEAKVPGLASKLVTEPSYPTAAQMDAAFDRINPPNPGSRKNPLAGLSASDYGGDAGTNIPGRDQGNDAVDRAINTLRRHTEQQLADSQAIGQGVGVMAAFRVQAAETAAVQANGGKETAKQAADFATLKIAATDAAIGLERAKIASDIKFGTNTAFLSQQDVAIASQLKGIYPDVAQALNSAEATAVRLNGSLKPVNDNNKDEKKGDDRERNQRTAAA